MKSFLVLGVILFLIGMGCKKSGAKQTEEATLVSNLAEPTNLDSIQQLYTKKLEERSDPLPSKQVIEVGKLNPVDEAPLDTSFFLFRDDLLKAIASRDIFSFIQHVDKNIKCSFGAENGLPAFIKMWELDTPVKTQSSKLWQTLEQILQNGGSFDQSRQLFSAPYIFSTFPDKYDGFEFGAIAGSGVRLRAGPGLNTETLKSISYNIIKIIGPSDKLETIQGETYPWIQVELLDGTNGYVFGKFVGRPIDFRAGFERQTNGGWKMSFLVAGD